MNNIGNVLKCFAILFFNCCDAKERNENVRQKDENPAVWNFREYLKIKTVHPDPKEGYGM